MTEIRHSIDWLQYSIAWPSGVDIWPIDASTELSIFKTCVPMLDVSGMPPARPSGDKRLGMRGYTKTYDMLWCSAHVDPNRRTQKIGVRFTGQDLSAYRDLGGTDDRLLQFVKHNNATPSRIDLAYDLFGYKIDPLVIYKDWLSGRVKTRARTVQPLSRATRTGADGLAIASTLYIGSRTSPVMVRIYEKGKQMGVDLDWCRVELEIKDSKAASVLQDCIMHGIGDTARALLIEAMPTVPYKFWKELTKGKSVALESVGRKKTQRQVWLENIVLPLVAHELNEEWEADEPTGLTQAVEALLRGNWQRRALEIRRQMGLQGG